MKKVTIYDVAKESGCSTATVSLALNGNHSIKKETRDKILNVSKILNYSPNYFGKGLTTQKTNTIGLMLPEITNPIYAQMIEGIELYLHEKGYNLILNISGMDKEKELHCFEMLKQNKVEGMIVFPTHEEYLTKNIISKGYSNSPLVFCGVKSSDDSINYIKSDDRFGAQLAVEKLIQSGNKRIAFIAPVSNEHQSYERLEGYKYALTKNNIEINPQLIIYCSMEYTEIYKKTKELLDDQKPDAIFCLYDFAAISVMRAIYEMGLKIPQDVSIIGYDNIQIAQYLPVALSTVESNSYKMGEVAAEMLFDIIEKNKTEVKHVVLKPKLISRESV